MRSFINIRKKRQKQLHKDKSVIVTPNKESAVYTSGVKVLEEYVSKKEVPHESQDVVLTKSCCTEQHGVNNTSSIVISSVGSGKTRGFVKSNLLNKGCSFVITDVKGDLVNEFGQYFEDSQSEFMPSYDVVCFDLKNPESSAKYNPFRYMHSAADVVNFVTSLIQNNISGASNHGSSDSFWDNAATNLIASAVFFMFETEPKRNWTIKKLMEIYNEYIADSKSVYVSALSNLSANSLANVYFSKVKGAEDRTWGSILATAGVALSPLEYPEILELTERDELNLERIANNRVAFFINMDDTNHAYDFLAGVLFTQMFRVLYLEADKYANHKCPEHVRFIMDDFANYKIPEIDKIISAARSRNISLEMICQSERQLFSLYGASADNIIANCTYVYIAGNDKSTEANIANRLGWSTKDVQNMVGKCVVMYPEGISVVDAKADYLKHPYYELLKKSPVVRPYSYAGEKRDFWDSFCGSESKHKDIENINWDDSDCRSVLIENMNISDKSLDRIASAVKLRRDEYDSNEEKLFFEGAFSKVVEQSECVGDYKIHYPLREIFDKNAMERVSEKFGYKLISMHVDFIAFDKAGAPLFACEIDGSQHNEGTQMVNDRIKDFVFGCAGIPLYRYRACDIRNSLASVKSDLYAKVNPNFEEEQAPNFEEEQAFSIRTTKSEGNSVGVVECPNDVEEFKDFEDSLVKSSFAYDIDAILLSPNKKEKEEEDFFSLLSALNKAKYEIIEDDGFFE